MAQTQFVPKKATKTLVLLTVFIHTVWSTLHVASRYLQVYAKPIPFDGQGVLSTTKGFSAVLLFVIGVVSSWIESCSAVGSTVKDEAEAENNSDSTSLTGNTSLTESQREDSCTALDAGIRLHEESEISQQQQSAEVTPGGEIATSQETDASSRRRKVVCYTILVGIVAVCRSSSNIAAAKWTYPYNSSECTIEYFAIFFAWRSSNYLPWFQPCNPSCITLLGIWLQH